MMVTVMGTGADGLKRQFLIISISIMIILEIEIGVIEIESVIAALRIVNVPDLHTLRRAPPAMHPLPRSATDFQRFLFVKMLKMAARRRERREAIVAVRVHRHRVEQSHTVVIAVDLRDG